MQQHSMATIGKGGKGGKGGKLFSGAKRHQRFLNKSTPNEKAMTKPAIRRHARRAGIKRISITTYAEARKQMKKQLEKVVNDALIYAEHARRKTITLPDGLFALKRNGQTMYHTTGNPAGAP